jgi:hypothetical protein
LPTRRLGLSLPTDQTGWMILAQWIVLAAIVGVWGWGLLWPYPLSDWFPYPWAKNATVATGKAFRKSHSMDDLFAAGITKMGNDVGNGSTIGAADAIMKAAFQTQRNDAIEQNLLGPVISVVGTTAGVPNEVTEANRGQVRQTFLDLGIGLRGHNR